jgi:homocitrate synthase NifV
VKVHVVDTTLRDGEQTAGLVFSAEEKVEIAKALDKAGVFAIEAGIPAMGPEEQEALRAILSLGLKAQVVAWNRASLQDILQAVSCGFSCIHVSIPVSDLHIRYKLRKSREWVLNRFEEALLYARSFGCGVVAGAEDASRADEGFFLQVAEVAAKIGAERIRFADTVGCLDPFRTYDIMHRMGKRCMLPIEVHLHNDFGLAAANTVSAVRAGVGLVSVTVGGIGERAGNASLENIVEVLNGLNGYDTGIDREMLPVLTNLVTGACNLSDCSLRGIS